MSASTARSLTRVAPPSPPPQPSRRLRLGILWPSILVLAVFVVAYDNGGYGLSSRSILAIALWWTIILGVGFGVLPRARLPRAALVVGGLLVGFAAWTLASTLWAASAEDAFNEVNRVSLYLAIFGLAVAAGTRRDVGRWADGLAIGIVATGIVSLSSRLFPHLFSTRSLGVFLPYAVTRLSFPVGYWNGLGILIGLAFPLCLRAAVVRRRRLVRAAALVPLPALAAVIYLTSSRGGVVTALLGIVVFLIATDRRWSAFAAALAAAAGSVLSIAVLLDRRTLVDGPLSSSVAVSQGRAAAVLICGCCVLGGLLFLAGERMLAGRSRPSPALGWAIVIALVVAALAGAALAHPVRRFEAFKQPLALQNVPSSDFVRAHLLSGNGSGRWQFWTVAVNEFRTAPLEGRGAGSYGSWWAQHAIFTYSLKNAHSLYLEVLGELGIVGFLLITGAFVAGLAAVLDRLRASRGEERVTLAALTATLVAFAVAAGIDWVWQLTVVGLVGVVVLGLVAGPATARGEGPVLARSEGGRPRSRLALGVGLLGIAWALICAQAIPWLAAAKISDSQAAVRRGDTRAALKDTLDARSLQPWAASPYLQLALVAEQRGDLADARRWIASAIHRDSKDWRVWLVASRLESESGLPAEAQRSYSRAASLNPRSPLFNQRSAG